MSSRTTEQWMLDTQSIAIDRFWHFARMGTLIAIALHGVFGLAAWLAGAMPLLALQVATVVIYSISYVLTGRGYRWLPTVLAWIDLLGHSTLACLIVGRESGFQYYSWILLPLLFANVHRALRTKIIVAAALIGFYVAVDWWLHRTTPYIEVSANALAGLRYFNIGCYLLALGVISIAHMRTVREAEQRLNAMASTDALTGLLNRRRMSDRLRQEWEKARESSGSLALILLDIDHFKAINDRYGHGRGDQVIAQVGSLLRTAMRREDWVGRWGGEEFLALLPNASLDAACETAERIRRAVSSQIVRDEGDLTPVTVTIGVAMWSQDESLDHTIDRADRALYRGKQAGRNRVVVADEREAGDDELLQAAG
jgi:diguanylate cyclase (GGDEF)-like protein